MTEGMHLIREKAGEDRKLCCMRNGVKVRPIRSYHVPMVLYMSAPNLYSDVCACVQ